MWLFADTNYKGYNWAKMGVESELNRLEQLAQPLITLAKRTGCREILLGLCPIPPSHDPRLPTMQAVASFVDFSHTEVTISWLGAQECRRPKTLTLFFGVDDNKLSGPIGCDTHEIATSINAVANLPSDVQSHLGEMKPRSYYDVLRWDSRAAEKVGYWREIRVRLTTDPLLLIITASRLEANFYGGTISFKIGDLFDPDFQERLPGPSWNRKTLQEVINEAYRSAIQEVPLRRH